MLPENKAMPIIAVIIATGIEPSTFNTINPNVIATIVKTNIGAKNAKNTFRLLITIFFTASSSAPFDTKEMYSFSCLLSFPADKNIKIIVTKNIAVKKALKLLLTSISNTAAPNFEYAISDGTQNPMHTTKVGVSAFRETPKHIAIIITAITFTVINEVQKSP